jgi:hypothetical protein
MDVQQFFNPKPFFAGKAAALALIESDGLPEAQRRLNEALPPGQPCRLSADDYRYWLGWRAAVLEQAAG